MSKTDKIVGIYEKKLRFKGYADNTICSYSYCVSLFIEFTDKRLSHIAKKDAYLFLDNCVDSEHTAKNQVISSLKLFYRFVLGTELDKAKTERPRKKKQLPRVVDSELLEHKLSQIKNLKHRAILELGYRCGLRVSEVCNLRIANIDSKRMLILIEDSKFNKDRYVPISKSLLRVLRCYYKEYKPTVYLFNGQFNDKYSVSSCQKIFKNNIDKSKSFHCLRHSYGTALVEKNVNMRVIQKALGHASSKTSEIYTHVSNISLQSAAL